MTKQEKILKQQVKELERLVEIKDAVIVELKSLVRPAYTYSPYTGTGGAGCGRVVLDSISNSTITTASFGFPETGATA